MMNDFSCLDPEIVLQAVEQAYGCSSDGSWSSYPSYVNRVYGLSDEDGNRFVVKFYRPGRWEYEAIADEHEFIFAAAEAELPVVCPVQDSEGYTIQELEIDGCEGSLFFSLFPLRSGRVFDADREEDYLRLGALIGRLHRIGRSCRAEHRLSWDAVAGETSLNTLLADDLIPASLRSSFVATVQRSLELIRPLFIPEQFIRLHGDCHRGNILDRASEGLMLIDFDDMLNGPPVQDLWLLLPGRIDDSRYEFMLLREGYEQFSRLPEGQERLVEPLRFLRMLHYLSWSARQRYDAGFYQHFPSWGSRAFWEKELYDFRDQLEIIERSLD